MSSIYYFGTVNFIKLTAINLFMTTVINEEAFIFGLPVIPIRNVFSSLYVE